ncbi:hypothetical protein DFJ77DRAFT_438961 [Powellomyces hirtus]|nr:hypothetical protein DFJ77DRAFT_438961 [Powellomyces hirtus]
MSDQRSPPRKKQRTSLYNDTRSPEEYGDVHDPRGSSADSPWSSNPASSNTNVHTPPQEHPVPQIPATPKKKLRQPHRPDSNPSSSSSSSSSSDWDTSGDNSYSRELARRLRRRKKRKKPPAVPSVVTNKGSFARAWFGTAQERHATWAIKYWLLRHQVAGSFPVLTLKHVRIILTLLNNPRYNPRAADMVYITTSLCPIIQAYVVEARFTPTTTGNAIQNAINYCAESILANMHTNVKMHFGEKI